MVAINDWGNCQMGVPPDSGEFMESKKHEMLAHYGWFRMPLAQTLDQHRILVSADGQD
jgi:hypothetical protein